MLPLNVVVAARVDGGIEVVELKSVIEKLRRRHALLAVRVVLSADGSGRYETDGVGEIPVRLIDAAAGQDWLSTVGQELRTPFPLEAGPLVRFAWIRAPEHSHLVVAAHHAICDGLSLTYLLRDVIEYLADPGRIVEVLPAPPAIDAATVPEPPTTGVVERWLTRLLNRRWEKSRLSFDQADMENLHETFWRRNGEPVLLAWEWPRVKTAALTERSRREGVTVNSALWSAFLAAQYDVQGDAEAFRREAGVAVSTRDRLSVPVGEALGFYASSLTARLHHDPHAGFWDGARKTHAKIRRALEKTDLFRMLKAEAIHPVLLDSLYFKKYGLISSRVSGVLLSKMRWNQTSYGFSITNVGRVNIATEFGPRKIEAVYGPVIYSDVNEKVVGVTTVSGRMTFSLTCNAEAPGLAVAERIAEGAMSHLERAIE